MGEAKYYVGGTWRTGIPQRMRHSGEEMGEAKAKLERRKAHATKIVAAFEAFIDANVLTAVYTSMGCDNMAKEYSEKIVFTREELIEVLVTPPPKE